MDGIRHSIGIDISTQSIAAMLIGVVEENGAAVELVISSAWVTSRGCADGAGRRNPAHWIELVRECIADLRLRARETESARAIGVSTTFPGAFAIAGDGSIDPSSASLYDNTDDAGIGDGQFEEALARAEDDTANRMWPGNMAIGLAHLARSRGLHLEDATAIVPPNSAFAHSLLCAVGTPTDPRALVSDFTEAVIGGLYDHSTVAPVPEGVARLLREALPEVDVDRLREMLPRAVPSWTNILPTAAIPAARDLLGLPNLDAVSIGAGDSPLGVLALHPGEDGILCVRGSTDSPMLLAQAPRRRKTPRETVLHYPLPTAASINDPPWCCVAPTLRSGKVWDWVRRLRFDDSRVDGDSELERLATQALRRRLLASPGSPGARALVFDTALGGERAPDWDPHATGVLSGLLESHSIGDIALAALEGTSSRLRDCLRLMESRYDASPSNLLLAGGPVHNSLWNWVTQQITGKTTYATTFSDASLLGAAMLGYGASYGPAENDNRVSGRLRDLSRLASDHPLIRPTKIAPPEDLRDLLSYT